MSSKTIVRCDHCDADITNADQKNNYYISMGSSMRSSIVIDNRKDPLPQYMQFCDFDCVARWLEKKLSNVKPFTVVK